LTVWFSDGTSLPLSAISDRDYSLLAETLDKDVVMLAPPRHARLVTIMAVSPGSGDLIRVSLDVDSTCPVVKRQPLVTGFALVKVDFDEMVQSDASYYHRGHDRFDLDPYSGPYLVARDRIIYSHSDRNRKGRRRKGKGRSSADGRGKTLGEVGRTSTPESVDDAGIVIPHVEAQHQRQEAVVEAPRKAMSSLELAMYILLAVFCASVVVFAANCLLFIVRRGRKQKLAEPKDQVLEVTASLLYSAAEVVPLQVSGWQILIIMNNFISIITYIITE